MTSQAFSASANVLKGGPLTLMAVLLRIDGAPRGYKARLPVDYGSIPTTRMLADGYLIWKRPQPRG
jgi:hypothetical protein